MKYYIMLKYYTIIYETGNAYIMFYHLSTFISI